MSDPYQNLLDRLKAQLDTMDRDLWLSLIATAALAILYTLLICFLVTASAWNPTQAPGFLETTTSPAPGASTY